MKALSRIGLIIVLLLAGIEVVLLPASAQPSGSANETRADQDNAKAKKLLVAGCFAGVVLGLILVITRIRGTGRRKREADRPTAAQKAGTERTLAFRCLKCGRVFRERIAEGRTVACPLCGHARQWPPAVGLKLLKDRMKAFSLDPDKPRADITIAARVISRFSKRFAGRVLSAGKYLDPGEMLCVCENCREIHIAQEKHRGLLGSCVKCKSLFVIL